mgnify:CR=1 FL=1
MEIARFNEWPRNSDGYAICACGCRRTFKYGDAILWAGFTGPWGSEKDVLYDNSIQIYCVYHVACVELASARTLDSMESRQSDLLELSKSNPTELQRLYAWMHDALRCRI